MLFVSVILVCLYISYNLINNRPVTYYEKGNLIYYRKGSIWKYFQYDSNNKIIRYKDNFGCNFHCKHEDVK